MGVAEGLQGDPQLHAALAVDVDELVVLQPDDVAVGLGHDLGHPQQLAGTVGQLDGEGEHPAPVDQPVLHQGGHGDHVHVAAGEDRHHVLALALQVVQGGDGQQAGVLHDHLVLLHHVQEGVHQLVVVDGDDVVDILLDIGEDLVTGGFHRHAVGNGLHPVQGDHMARLHAGLHGGRAGGLHADHRHVGVEQLGQGGHAGGQPAAADGHQDHVHIGEILEDLVGDGALPGGQGGVVEGVDVGEPLLLGQPGGQLGGVVEGLPVEHHLGPVVLGVVHLHQGSGGGHDDGGLHPGVLGGVGHALGVVARGGGDQPAGLLLVAEGADLIVGAPDLVRAGELHVLRLDVHLVAGGLGKGGAVDQRGVPDHTGEHAAGLFEILECEHGADFLSVG